VFYFPHFTKSTFSDDIIVTKKFSLKLKVTKYFSLQFYFCFCIRLFWKSPIRSIWWAWLWGRILWLFLGTLTWLICRSCTFKHWRGGSWVIWFKFKVFFHFYQFSIILFLVIWVLATWNWWIHTSHKVIMQFINNWFSGILWWRKCDFLRFLFHVNVWVLFWYFIFICFLIFSWWFIFKYLIVKIFGFWK